MAISKKPPPRNLAPITSPDAKRTFDARPKPSEDRRREDSVRPTHHIDRARHNQGLDDPEAE
jgi:hypothetical protein